MISVLTRAIGPGGVRHPRFSGTWPDGLRRCKVSTPFRNWTGRPARDHRTIINGFLWVLCTGAPWRDLPERYGFWQTVASRFWRWREAGIWDWVLAELRRQADAEAGRSTMWTAPQCELTSTQPVQKGGFSTKVHVRAEGKGKLMALVLTPGERHEALFFTVDGRRGG